MILREEFLRAFGILRCQGPCGQLYTANSYWFPFLPKRDTWGNTVGENRDVTCFRCLNIKPKQKKEIIYE